MKAIVILFFIAVAAIALMGAAGPDAQAGLTVVGIIIIVVAAMFILIKIIQVIAAIIKILIPLAIVLAIFGFGIAIMSGLPFSIKPNTAGSFGYNYQYDPATCHLSQSYPTAILQWCGLIEKYASQYNVDPNLIAAVMLQESGGRQDAYSKSGAVGLLQVMPRDGKAANFMCTNGPCFADRPTSDQLYDPEFNVSYGAKMLAELIQLKGNIRDALKSYGPMDVGYYYADIVINIMNQHR